MGRSGGLSVTLLAAALALGGCGNSTHVVVDSGVPDAGTPDGGTPDEGTPDSGMPDAGSPDAGTPDAGMPDSGMPDGGTPQAVVDCDPLVPEICGFPFPSDAYTIEDETSPTGLRVRFGPGLMRGSSAAAWDKSDGFSTGNALMTYFDGGAGFGETPVGAVGHIDDGLGADSAIVVIEADTGDRVPYYADFDPLGKPTHQSLLLIRPIVRLKDATRYIVGVRGVRDAGGALVPASPAFAALRDGTPFTDDPSVDARRPRYDDIFGKLSAAGMPRASLQMAWDFTTASDENNWTWLVHMRDDALSRVGPSGPAYTIGEVNDNTNGTTDDDWNPDTIAFRINGTMTVPLYMTGAGPNSDLVFGPDGLPMVNPAQPTAEVPFEVLIPKSALDAPGGLIEYGHGLFGSRSQIENGNFRTFINKNDYVFFGVDLWGMAESDTAAVGFILGTGNLGRISTMFDRLHQGFVNELLVMRMMKTGFANDPTYGKYIDPSRAYYYGISQGGIQGAVFMALSTDIERGVLEVMGQPYSLLVFRSKDFDPFLEILHTAFPDPRVDHLAVGLVQMLWDRVEPNGYSQHIVRDPLPGTEAKEALLRAALGDHQVNNIGAHIIARTMQLPHVDTGIAPHDIFGLTTVTAPLAESAYLEYGFGLPIRLAPRRSACARTRTTRCASCPPRSTTCRPS